MKHHVKLLFFRFGFALLVPLLAACPSVSTAAVSWSMVVLADTHQQGYFPGMTQWIVANKDTRNINLVLHNGDIVNSDGGEGGWADARAAMSTLDGEVPYMIAPGNHDMGSARSTFMNDYFALADNPLNNSATEGIVTVERVPGELENTYSTFTASDGRNMLVFSLEFGPRQAVVDWANSIASQPQYQNHTAILSTHTYMDLVSQGGRDSSRWNPHSYSIVAPDCHDGEELWQELVGVNGNFEMTFNGHYIGAVDRQQSVGTNGNTVHEMVHNRQYQTYGYMRLLEFLDDQKTVQVRTYCTNGTWLTDSANEFQFELTQAGDPPPNISVGLIAHYEFEQDNNDSSDNGHTGTVVGNGSIVNDAERGWVYSNPDSTSYVDIDNTFEIPSLPADAGVTLAAWIKRDNVTLDYAGNYAGVICLGRGGDNPIMEITIRNDGALHGYIEGDGEGYDQVTLTSPAGAVTNEVWTHVAITFDRANDVAKLYVDGTQSGSDVDISLAGDGLLEWTHASVGGSAIFDTKSIYRGLIDDACIYYEVLSADEIAALLLGNIPDYWDLNGDEIVDHKDLSLLLSNFDAGDTDPSTLPYGQADLEDLLDVFGSPVSSASAVPEPTSMVLLVFGAMGLLAVRRRK